jgi:hypothetical protein
MRAVVDLSLVACLPFSLPVLVRLSIFGCARACLCVCVCVCVCLVSFQEFLLIILNRTFSRCLLLFGISCYAFRSISFITNEQNTLTRFLSSNLDFSVCLSSSFFYSVRFFFSCKRHQREMIIDC